jgi:hypothetical protein
VKPRGFGSVSLAGTCVVLLLILLTLVATACGAAAADVGGAHSSSPPVPVSQDTYSDDWLGTTSTGAGPADLYCSVAFAASQPKGTVHVSLFTEAGELIDARDGMDGMSPGHYYTFKGLEPGNYRLGVFGVGTGYVSQWYGGLPVQGHDVSEPQILELKPGRNLAEFVLQPGLSIEGEVSYAEGTPQSGHILVYDLQHRYTGGGGPFGGDTMKPGTRYHFLVVGLLPGRYRIGASFDTNDPVPQVWDGGGSFEDAPVIDLTSADVAGLSVNLGIVPTATTSASLQ